jgi:hypothetical protein
MVIVHPTSTVKTGVKVFITILPHIDEKGTSMTGCKITVQPIPHQRQSGLDRV